MNYGAKVCLKVIIVVCNCCIDCFEASVRMGVYGGEKCAEFDIQLILEFFHGFVEVLLGEECVGFTRGLDFLRNGFTRKSLG